MKLAVFNSIKYSFNKKTRVSDRGQGGVTRMCIQGSLKNTQFSRLFLPERKFNICDLDIAILSTGSISTAVRQELLCPIIENRHNILLFTIDLRMQCTFSKYDQKHLVSISSLGVNVAFAMSTVKGRSPPDIVRLQQSQYYQIFHTEEIVYPNLTLQEKCANCNKFIFKIE